MHRVKTDKQKTSKNTQTATVWPYGNMTLVNSYETLFIVLYFNRRMRLFSVKRRQH